MVGCLRFSNNRQDDFGAGLSIPRRFSFAAAES
jgi:hypothetical protein